MEYDVVVVGGGIGGLTVAALLAARGVNVCLFERNSQVGGCVARVQYSGLNFEPGMGLYPDWGPGEIHDQIFAQLPVPAPETRVIDDDYVVRLEDGIDVRLCRDRSDFNEELRRVFPECADAAIEFYELVDNLRNYPAEKNSSSIFRRVRRLWSGTSDHERRKETTVQEYAIHTSIRFQRFVDAQLRAFMQTPIERCAFAFAAPALTLPRSPLYSIGGGPATVVERLAEAIKLAGGIVRLNSSVLRLVYNAAGDPIGVDLLSGERVIAKRAIVSNMTIWDTYGRLIGLDRTPLEVKKALATQKSNGAYVVYATLQSSALRRLPGENFLMSTDFFDDAGSEITFATAIDPSTSSGQLAVTLKTTTPVTDWFAFHSSEADFEEWDQAALEAVWNRLHRAVPELGGDIEVVETANPRTFYEQTRRKLGMVLGIERPANSPALPVPHTTLANVYILGDTVSSFPSLAAVSRTASRLADQLSR